jgi:CheY-like chemotaxis protein
VSDGGAKILLVDDETAILDTLKILFRGEGYEVSTSRTPGHEGPSPRSPTSWKPDLVLTDIRMPGATGLEVLAHARESTPRCPSSS